MANALSELFTEQANAIREGLGDIGRIKPADFPARTREIVSLISSGGGSSDDVRYVTFMSDDGTVEYGKLPVATGYDCPNPKFAVTKESTAQYDYSFYGWATTPNGAADANWNKAVTEDRTVYANFAAVVRYYTITYLDTDGSVLKTESLVYGAMPSYAPEKNGYKLTGWEPAFATVTGDASYVAQWQEQLKLADYTWAQIDEMTIEEVRGKFALGDLKDGYVLVGFEQDTLSNGTKAKMTFIYHDLSGQAQYTFASGNWNTECNNAMSYCGKYTASLSTYVYKYSDISPYAKQVKKKYVSDKTNLTIAERMCAFWFPSLSELGYTPDGTTVLNEGNKYELFPDKATISEKVVTAVGYYFNIGNRAIRSVNATNYFYLNAGKPTQMQHGSVGAGNVYYFTGFCI